MTTIKRLLIAATVAGAAALAPLSASAFWGWGGPFNWWPGGWGGGPWNSPWNSPWYGGYPHGYGYHPYGLHHPYGWGVPAHGWGVPAYGWGVPAYGYPFTYPSHAAPATSTGGSQ